MKLLLNTRFPQTNRTRGTRGSIYCESEIFAIVVNRLQAVPEAYHNALSFRLYGGVR